VNARRGHVRCLAKWISKQRAFGSPKWQLKQILIRHPWRHQAAMPHAPSRRPGPSMCFDTTKTRNRHTPARAHWRRGRCSNPGLAWCPLNCGDRAAAPAAWRCWLRSARPRRRFAAIQRYVRTWGTSRHGAHIVSVPQQPRHASTMSQDAARRRTSSSRPLRANNRPMQRSKLAFIRSTRRRGRTGVAGW